MFRRNVTNVLHEFASSIPFPEDGENRFLSNILNICNMSSDPRLQQPSQFPP
jgi:hypothetical protein